ncbi:MucR family transcriptional regulator [Thalassobaculum sp.]|jgi:predicted transcriptional regulator|uniref:MucR family transcriptional regulator n=1 Tax=Thalassobaculum sp. TaxID=2022740 RepID=UPI0032EE6AAE
MSDDAMNTDSGAKSLIEMTTTVVAAYLGNNSVASNQISEVINAVHDALRGLSGDNRAPAAEPLRPAVSIKKSIMPDYIVCLEDGKQLKMLKRHLRTAYGLTPDEYRAKWGLPADYPMVAPNYAQQRSEFAKKIGLGSQTTRRTRKRKAG